MATYALDGRKLRDLTVGTDFPADVPMAPTFALLAATNDTETATIDWWKIAQLRA